MQAYVDRHLIIASAKFLIFPNCGKGDCLFKAIGQALHEGDDQSHYEVRKAVVEYVVARKWDYLKGSIEVQHVLQNEHLQEAWTEDPVSAYKDYMTSPGALGSMSELAAAAGLFKFNFVTIQEYDLTEGISYRVENCKISDDSQVPLYFFFFTGDFDNGHWECLHPVGDDGKHNLLSDGIHCGTITTLINGEECSFDNWLKIHTENTNSPFDLKCDTFCRIPASVDAQYPFDLDMFQFEQDESVELDGERFRIHGMKYVDLFSVITSILLKGCDDEGTISQLEAEILDYRIENFSELNDKLIKQPHSHGFNLANLKYISMPSKGNVQDLLTAACIRNFCFRIFMKPSKLSPLQSCTFIHSDRWGGKSDKMVNFFLTLVNCPKTDEIIGKWWHLLPNRSTKGQNIDLNENFCSGESSSDATDNDASAVQQHDCQQLTLEDSSMSNVPQPTGNSEMSKNDNEHKAGFVPEQNSVTSNAAARYEDTDLLSAKESQGTRFVKCKSSTESTSESDMQVVTVVEAYDDKSKSTRRYQFDKYISKDMVAEALLNQNKDVSIGPCHLNSADHPRTLPDMIDVNNNFFPNKDPKKWKSPSLTTLTSEESMLNARHNFKFPQSYVKDNRIYAGQDKLSRRQGYAQIRNNRRTKKSVLTKCFEKCFPCSNFNEDYDV